MTSLYRLSYNPAMKKTVLTEEELNDLKVTLKPVLGIKPEQYIKGVYLFLVLVAFFLVFFLPGLLKNGTWYNFTSTPPGASVYADGIRLGATPGCYFVPRGKRTISLQTPYTCLWSEETKVGGKVFGTLFVKRSRDMHIQLESSVTSESLSSFHKDAAAWFSSDEGYSALPLPPVLPDLMKSVYRSTDRNKADVSDDELAMMLTSLLRTASEENAYNQWLEGYGLYAVAGASLNPGTLLKAASEAAVFLKENPQLIGFLENYHDLPELQLIKEQETDLISINPAPSIRPLEDDSLVFAAAGRLKSSGELIYAADREITKGLYLLFLNENPAWSPAQKETLQSEGLVDENYLADWDISKDYSSSREVLNYVSLPAAEAFCDWLDRHSFPGRDMTVRLPDEWEWEEIARANGQDSKMRPSQKNLGPLEAGSTMGGTLNLYDMDGNLWEWCRNGFGTNDLFLYNSLSKISMFDRDMPTFAVRGGSWANDPGEVGAETRASQPASWCTPYIGFRPVLLIQR